MALFELPASEHVNGLVMSYPEQPGEQSTATGLIGAWLSPQFEKRFLDNVFGRRGVAEQSQRQRVHAATVTVVDALESARIATSDLLDKERVLVARGVKRGPGGCLRPTASKGEPEFHGQASISPVPGGRNRQSLSRHPGATSLYVKVRTSARFRFKLRLRAYRDCPATRL